MRVAEPIHKAHNADDLRNALAQLSEDEKSKRMLRLIGQIRNASNLVMDLESIAISELTIVVEETSDFWLPLKRVG